jgi:hypothetical protein
MDDGAVGLDLGAGEGPAPLVTDQRAAVRAATRQAPAIPVRARPDMLGQQSAPDNQFGAASNACRPDATTNN